MQNDKRVGHRVTSASQCLLSHCGSKYPGVLEDISISGALVSMTNSLPYVVQLGDTCDLECCGELSFPDEYSSKVVRIDSHKVGLQFNE